MTCRSLLQGPAGSPRQATGKNYLLSPLSHPAIDHDQPFFGGFWTSHFGSPRLKPVIMTWASLVESGGPVSVQRPISVQPLLDPSSAPLVVDTSGIISGLGLFNRSFQYDFYTVPEVWKETRDAYSREALGRAPITTREPEEESLEAVKRFARAAGELASLSLTDLKLIALTHSLEVALHGPAALRTAPPPPQAAPRRASAPSELLPGWGAGPVRRPTAPVHTAGSVAGSRAPSVHCASSQAAPAGQGEGVEAEDWELAGSRKALRRRRRKESRRQQRQEGHTQPAFPSTASQEPWPSDSDDESSEEGEERGVGNGERREGTPPHGEAGPHQLTAAGEESGDSLKEQEGKGEEQQGASEQEEEEESSSSEGEKEEEEAGDKEGEGKEEGEGTEHHSQTSGAPGGVEEGGPVACVTADYAMQNVLLQMGLGVMAPSGLRIRKLTHWGKRCSACSATTKDMERGFCERCGNATLQKVEVVVGAGGVELFGVRKKHILKGTRFSLPKPKGGKHAKVDVRLLTEDMLKLRRGKMTR